jgi:hypothetical protein
MVGATGPTGPSGIAVPGIGASGTTFSYPYGIFVPPTSSPGVTGQVWLNTGQNRTGASGSQPGTLTISQGPGT